MERKNLDSLQRRRKIVQSISEHSQNRRCSIQKFDVEQHQPNRGCATFTKDISSDQSNDIIENSDTETQPINVTKRTNITTSSDGDINTSTISLPLSNSAFFGDDVGKLIPPNSPFKNIISNEKKINIISVEVIKCGNSTSDTNTYSELGRSIEDSTNQPVSSNSLSPAKSLNNNFVLTDEFYDRPEISCSPTLDLNSLPENFYAIQPKPSCQIASTELSTLDLELSFLHADSCTTSKVSHPGPRVETSILNTVPLTFNDVKQTSALSEEIKPEPSSTRKSSPISTANITQDSPKIRNKRTLKISSFKKSCMDFLPEEEVLDFSDGSSDDWTCNESESDGSSGSPKTKKKKLNKKKVINKDNLCDKRKREKKINQRRERRKLREAGKAYENHKGDKVQEKSIRSNPCEPAKCKRRCYTISEDRRKSLFDFFWSLDLQRRKDWIINSSRVVPVGRKRTASPSSRRNLTYEYYINNGNDHQKVCQKFLLEIQINFLLPGHTYMPVDSVHATIEREVQKMTVWSPSQWAPYIASARKRPRPYEVVVMDNNDFINWEELTSKTFTKSTLQNIKFKHIRIATFKKQNTDQVEIKYSTHENSLAEKIALCKESEKELMVKGKRKGKGKGKRTAKGQGMKEKTDNEESQKNKFNFVLRKLYNSQLPISIAKFKDLKHLCNIGVIPRPYHSEFLQLPHSKQTEDTLNQTDEEDEVKGDSE